MRILVLYNKDNKSSKLIEISKGLQDAFLKQGYDVDLVDAKGDYSNKRFAFYDYICIGTDFLGTFSTKIDSNFARVLESFGSLGNQRCFAFIKKSIRGEKKLSALMKLMEKMGMFIKNSNIIANKSQALVVGENLNVHRS